MRATAREAGALFLIAKPFDEDTFQEVLEPFIDRAAVPTHLSHAFLAKTFHADPMRRGPFEAGTRLGIDVGASGYRETA